jgi:hypothetical protein
MPLNDLDLVNTSHAAETQIDRILRSNTFRSAEALRKLLRFLADRLAAGDADQLKEYSVGIDGLGKPADYDPRQDSTVRIQVGRLRHKLAEFYRSEGLNDPHIVEIPKGHFKLSVTPRPVPAGAVADRGEAPSHKATHPFWIGGLAAALVIAVAWAAIASVQLRREQQESSVFRSMWTPGLEQLWEPFLSSQRPVILAIEDPPFAQFAGYGAYREMNLNSWPDIEKSARIAEIRKLLGNPEMTPSHYYAPVGEVSAAFLLGRFLGPRVPAFSLSVVRDLSWQQLASHNVIYVGASVFFTDRFNGLPAAIDLDYVPGGGIRNAHPGPGELAVYPEQYQNASESGELYAIVTHVPGPSGSGDVTSFTSMRTPSRLGAVQWFTDAAHASELVTKMKNATGQMPRYFQVLLRVTFKDSVPTQASYILHHDLSDSGRAAKSAP